MTADQVLGAIEKTSKWEFLPIIGAEKGRFLEQLVREKKPCQAVEVGVMVGYTTILIARNLPEGCTLTGLEISEELAKRAEENIVQSGLSDRVAVRRGDARQSLDEVSGPVDLVFLDAQKSQYLSYLKKLEPKLSPGAVIVANGTAAFGRELKPYLEYVRKSGNYQSASQVFGSDALEVSFYRK